MNDLLNRNTTIFLLVLAVLLTAACGGDEPTGTSKGHSVLGDREETFVDSTGALTSDAPAAIAQQIDGFAATAAKGSAEAAVTVDFPHDGSIFPPEFVAPTFYWHDAAGKADTWLVTIDFADDDAGVISLLLPGNPPPEPVLDLEAIGETNEVYQGTEYQRSARAWRPTSPLWEEIKRRSVEKPATVTFTGFAAGSPTKALSTGTTKIMTSKDPVGAPFFYRDVPLMAAVGKHGQIVPLGAQAIPLIAWRLRNVALEEPKLVLKGMPSCGNCHSFSDDGKTLGMDVDGPDGDKGMYAIKPIEEQTVISYDDVITWNSFPDKPKDHSTIGFMSKVSPDGRWVASTVNEALFVKNFQDYKFLQVFYPTRGIIGVYNRDEEKFSSLGGADDPEYVHCSPVWTPDGKWVIFSRTKASEPYTPGMSMPERPNDPREPQVQYDLCRVPFNDGKGGEPELIEGASNNGFSNTFPKVSPDGKWIVWTRCKNGLLMRPDGKLCMVPVEGGEPRLMECNTPLMNSWHSFSPNSRWMVFSSKSRTPYTQAFLTHIDEDGTASPAILVPNSTAANRAVNLPEFLNAPYEALDTITIPAVDHHIHKLQAERMVKAGDYSGARDELLLALEKEPTFVRALVNLGYVLIELGYHDRALLYLERASELEPRSLFALLNRTEAYSETGRLFMAQKCINRLIEVAPGYPDAGQIKQRIDRSREGLAIRIAGAEKALESDPKSIRIHQDLADMSRRAGRLEDSVAYQEKSIELSEDAPPLVAGLGWMLATNPDEKIRDGKRAVKLAEKAVTLTGGKRPEPLDILAVALAEVGDFETALTTMDRAIALAKEVAPNLVPQMEARREILSKSEPIRTPRDR